MKTNFFHKNYKVLTTALVVFLFLIGLAAFYNSTIKFGDESGFLIYRSIRGIVCFVYLAIIILFQKKEPNPLLNSFLVLYGLSSLLTIGYENNTLATLSMGLNILAFMMLIRAILPKVNLFKLESFHILSFMIMIVFMGFLSYQFIIMFKDMTQSNLHFIFIVLNTFGLVFTTYLGVLFNHKYSSRNTIVFLGFIVLLLFTEAFRGIAYYDMAYGDFSAHIARFILIISISLLMHYAFMKKKDEELLNNKFF